MQKNYLNNAQILKLKRELMSKNKKDKNKSNFSYSSSLSSEYYTMRNKEIGINFENNVRNILKFYYGWKEIKLKRKIKARDIICENNIYMVTDIEKQELYLNGKKITFQMNENKSIDLIIDGESTNFNSQKPFNYKLFGKIITINPPIDMELDCLFENFDLNKFDKSEIRFIIKNINNNLEITNFKKVAIEIKLNKKKIEDLLNQLIRDKKFLENEINEDILYLGFVNSKGVDHEKVAQFKEKNKNLNFIILGLNNSIFCNKDVTKFYDWEEIIDNKKTIEKITMAQKNFDTRLSNLETKVDQIISLLKKKRRKALSSKKVNKVKDSSSS